MESLTPPPPLSLSGNLAENWRKWEQRLNLYFVASGLTDKSEERKIAVMLHCVGEDALEIYNALNVQYADAQAKKMEEVLTAFRQYCAPRKNTVFERHQFWAHKHNEEAGIDKFVTELRLRARDCEFGESEDLMLRDKIVFSIADHRLRERLLSTADLPLHKAIDICRAKEAATMQARAMAPNSSTEEQLVHAVSNTGRFAKYAKPQPNSARVALQEEWRTRACRNCGRLHKPRQCPAYNMDCRKCGKKNHFAAVCRSNPDVALVEAEAPDVNALYIAGISRAHKGNSRDTGWSSSLRVGGTVVTFKLDTGAEANVLPLAVAEGLPMPLNMQRTDTVLVAYGGARIQPKGVVKLLVQARRKQAQLYFFVTDASDTPLLGRQACVQLDLVRRVEALARSAPATKQQLLQQYSSVFEGLDDGDLGDEKVIYVATTDPPLGGSITQLVQAASETDEEMLLLKDLHTGGWPDRRKSVPPRAQPYWSEQLPSNQREPLLPHPVPDAPWQRIAADIFELQGRPFLLITDYYSKFRKCCSCQTKLPVL
ncbi:hypothetical protein AAFF_G00128750 [Aldrovandia affinis]|uniref:Peptidase A2 domain-containing protein n=1 Tax=Aldrovandia affinis TaxID=143900 RepID=A0AAD7T186_9TELE|nr:hypothetical protein AAFF_G00128750 [Aldrovandia affinis]